jgi:hypothetical protein
MKFVRNNLQNKLRGKVEFTPMGNKIKFRVVGNLVCSRNRLNPIRKSLTCDVDWYVWNKVFTKIEAQRFIKRNRKICKVIPLGKLWYDHCEQFA